MGGIRGREYLYQEIRKDVLLPRLVKEAVFEKALRHIEVDDDIVLP